MFVEGIQYALIRMELQTQVCSSKGGCEDAMNTAQQLHKRICEIDQELKKIETPSSIIQWLVTEKQVLTDVIQGRY